MNFKEAAEFFKNKAVEVEAMMGEMALAGAEIVEQEAKAELGKYQDAVGPFPKWEPLKEGTKKRRAAMGYPEDEPLLLTGQLKDSIHSVLTPAGAVVGTNILYAVDLEFGNSRMQPRPFLNRAAFVKQEEIIIVQKELLKDVFK